MKAVMNSTVAILELTAASLGTLDVIDFGDLPTFDVFIPDLGTLQVRAENADVLRKAIANQGDQGYPTTFDIGRGVILS